MMIALHGLIFLGMFVNILISIKLSQIRHMIRGKENDKEREALRIVEYITLACAALLFFALIATFAFALKAYNGT